MSKERWPNAAARDKFASVFSPLSTSVSVNRDPTKCPLSRIPREKETERENVVRTHSRMLFLLFHDRVQLKPVLFAAVYLPSAVETAISRLFTRVYSAPEDPSAPLSNIVTSLIALSSLVNFSSN